jgi:hypothetical protein
MVCARMLVRMALGRVRQHNRTQRAPSLLWFVCVAHGCSSEAISFHPLYLHFFGEDDFDLQGLPLKVGEG